MDTSTSRKGISLIEDSGVNIIVGWDECQRSIQSDEVHQVHVTTFRRYHQNISVPYEGPSCQLRAAGVLDGM